MLTHVDCTGEDLALREYGKPVAEVGHVVLGRLVANLKRLVALEG